MIKFLSFFLIIVSVFDGYGQNVGIGTSNPNSKLDFLAKLESFSGGAANWVVNGGGYSDDNPVQLAISEAGGSLKLYTSVEYVPSAKFGNKLISSGSGLGASLIWIYGE